jgi:hypothetical protein
MCCAFDSPVDVVGENRVEVDRGRFHDKVGASRHLRNLRLEAVDNRRAGRNHGLSRDLRQQADVLGRGRARQRRVAVSSGWIISSVSAHTSASIRSGE